MLRLLAASVLWALSFGLIKRHLAGLDSTFVSFVRMALSGLALLPWLPVRNASRHDGKFMVIGIVQFGLMYVLYIAAFRHLPAHQIALFTIVTPVWVVVLDQIRTRSIRAWNLVAATLAVSGALALQTARPTGDFWLGFLLVQGSNVCFAAGQIAYRELSLTTETDHRRAMSLAFVGAAVFTGIGLLTWGDVPETLSNSQVLVLGYLGLLASALGFLLWNAGTTQVGPAMLAVWNNAKIPLAVLASIVVFGESADWPRLTAATALMGGAVWLAHTKGSSATPSKPPNLTE